MLFNSIQMPPITTIISTAAAIAAYFMLIRSIMRKYVSPDVQDYIYSKLGSFVSLLFCQKITLIIEEFDDSSGVLRENELFKVAELYLPTIIVRDTKVIKINWLPKQQSNFLFSMEECQETLDKFKGVTYKWEKSSKEIESTSRHCRLFRLSFHKKYKERAFDTYLPHLLSEGKEKMSKTFKLFTLNKNYDGTPRSSQWESIQVNHPVTFETLAMDSEMKRHIIDDLERFVNRSKFYKRVGLASKRGYLLYGPPGTGKSSLVAAMANHLKFNIYDLELTDIRDNSQFRRLLVSIANRSILVVENIDLSIDLEARRKTAARAMDRYGGLEEGFQVTLSGLLNFIDGLWSSCVEEQIIIITTNHKNRLDPALLRPGRMDVHIHMSYCTPDGFKTLASNYFGMTQHACFSEVEQLIEMTKVTPAEICGQLLRSTDPEIALEGLIEFLEEKKQSGETRAGAIVLGPPEEECTPELNGNEVQS